jgi:hypothetical protein
MIPRLRLASLLVTLGAATSIAACAEKKTAWECHQLRVPGGTQVECVGTSESALTGTYGCNMPGTGSTADYNPDLDCPTTTDFAPTWEVTLAGGTMDGTGLVGGGAGAGFGGGTGAIGGGTAGGTTGTGGSTSDGTGSTGTGGSGGTATGSTGTGTSTPGGSIGGMIGSDGTGGASGTGGTSGSGTAGGTTGTGGSTSDGTIGTGGGSGVASSAPPGTGLVPECNFVPDLEYCPKGSYPGDGVFGGGGFGTGATGTTGGSTSDGTGGTGTGTGTGTGDGTGGTGTGTGTAGNGNGNGGVGNGNGNGNTKGTGDGTATGTGTGTGTGGSGGYGGAGSSGGGSGSAGGGGITGSGPGGSGGAKGPGFDCTSDGRGRSCHSAPVCVPGTHPAPCGACVPDASGAEQDCQPPSTGGCWFTGGGFVLSNDGKDNMGGNAKGMKDGRIQGHWNHVDHGTGNHVLGKPSYLVCRTAAGPGPSQPGGKKGLTANQVYFGGEARWRSNGAWADGYWFDVVAEDHGEPGNVKSGGVTNKGTMPDWYHITVRQQSNPTTGVSGAVVYEVSGSIEGGNFQLHPPNNGHPYNASPLPAWVKLEH